MDMDDERLIEYNWGRNRLRELLKLAGFDDVRILKASLHGDWKLKFRKIQFYQPNRDSPSQYDEDGWETDWRPLPPGSEWNQELWPVLREKVCLQTTLSHAQAGQIIDSSGKNLGFMNGFVPEDNTPSATTNRRKVSRTVPAAPRPASPDITIKNDEEIDPHVFLHSPEIDLTYDTPSPPADHYDGPAFEDHQYDEPTGPTIIDLTQNTVVDLTTEEDVELMQDKEDEGAPDHQAGSRAESDRNSLFEGEGISDSDDSSLGLDNEEEIPLQSPDLSIPYIPSVPLVPKKGRKRALDLLEDAPDKDKPPMVQPRKRIRPSRGIKGPSLFTAVQGRAMVKKRDGRYTAFNAAQSAGSMLAKKKSNPTGEEEVPQAGPSIPLEVRPAPTVDDLEDYEDEDDVLPPIVQEPTPTRSNSMWDKVSRPSNLAENFSQLRKIDNRGKIRDPSAPPLFLLRLSRDTTLRLMMREWSSSFSQWCYIPRHSTEMGAFKEEDALHDDSTYDWIEHDTHILLLAPQFHVQPWHASSIRQENLTNLINETQDDHKARQLRRELELERDASWIDGELEKADVFPRVADIVEAERLVFSFEHRTEIVHIDEAQYGVQKRRPGGWAELVPYTHKAELPGRLDVLEYEQLSQLLAKKKKFLLMWSPLVDAHYKRPHTLVLFSSRSQDMFNLFSIPESFPRGKNSLVMVHLGRRLPFYDALPELDMAGLLQTEGMKPD